MKNRKQWLMVMLLALALAAATAHASKIFSDGFEDDAVIEGEQGNLWDQMHWDEGTWE